MEFSKNSWHYKLVNKFYGEEYFIDYEVKFSGRGFRGHTKVDKNISLCKYFWSVVLATFATALYMPIKYLLVIPIGFIVRKISSVIPSVEIEVNLPRMSYETRDKVGKVVLGFFLGIVIGLAIYGLIVKFWATFWYIVEIGIVVGVWVGARLSLDYIVERRRRRDRETKLPKDPNLVKEFVKAKKSKICPIIKFKDDNNFDSNFDNNLDNEVEDHGL